MATQGGRVQGAEKKNILNEFCNLSLTNFKNY
jgi:hypothetical protein